MCDQKSTYITNYLNHFCDIEIKLKHKISIFQKPNFEIEIQFFQNLSKYKNMILKQIWSMLWIESNTHIRYIYVFDIKSKIG